MFFTFVLFFGILLFINWAKSLNLCLDLVLFLLLTASIGFYLLYFEPYITPPVMRWLLINQLIIIAQFYILTYFESEIITYFKAIKFLFAC